MEKRGIIKEGITPPEDDKVKLSQVKDETQLEDHVTTRTAEAAKDGCKKETC